MSEQFTRQTATWMEQFIRYVDTGLSREKKTLPSRYFYDKRGDALFVKIMHLPEYYLFAAEREIFSRQTAAIAAMLEVNRKQHMELIELGAGDGTKTRYLLRWLMNEGFRFDYLPVDISPDALNELATTLKKELPDLQVTPRQGDYFDVLQSLKNSSRSKVVLFLGSNIGNLSDEKARRFMTELSAQLHPGDKLLLGVDLIKSKDIVIPAYNDSQGVTRDFNLNLLTRINRELGGNFDESTFRHVVEYTEAEGIVKSYLESRKDQDVYIEKTGKTYSFLKGERIWTEISRKYNDAIIRDIIAGSRFSVTTRLTDSRGYFADYILTIVDKNENPRVAAE